MTLPDATTGPRSLVSPVSPVKPVKLVTHVIPDYLVSLVSVKWMFVLKSFAYLKDFQKQKSLFRKYVLGERLRSTECYGATAAATAKTPQRGVLAQPVILFKYTFSI